MQNFLILLRTRLVRLAIRRRPVPAKAPDACAPAPAPQAAANTTILSYDSFR